MPYTSSDPIASWYSEDMKVAPYRIVGAIAAKEMEVTVKLVYSASNCKRATVGTCFESKEETDTLVEVKRS